MAEKLYRLDILSNENGQDQLLGLLALEAPYGWEEAVLPDGQIKFSLHAENLRALENLRERVLRTAPEVATSLVEVENQDWLAAWREFFTPVLCGSRFVVLPPWQADADFDGRQKLLIEPKSAFGTGHHASTALCLAAISDLADEGKIKAGQQFLDLGCGSGILSLAAASLGLAGLGLDIDQLAVDNALENKALNNAKGVDFALGDVAAAKGRQFELVAANILAGPLTGMAPDLARIAAPGGALVLSGILDRQAQQVEEAYLEQGLESVRVMADGEWRALVMERPAK